MSEFVRQHTLLTAASSRPVITNDKRRRWGLRSESLLVLKKLGRKRDAMNVTAALPYGNCRRRIRSKTIVVAGKTCFYLGLDVAVPYQLASRLMRISLMISEQEVGRFYASNWMDQYSIMSGPISLSVWADHARLESIRSILIANTSAFSKLAVFTAGTFCFLI